jgi:hypothetical protein
MSMARTATATTATPATAALHKKASLDLEPVPRLSLNVSEACAALGVSWDVWRQHVEPRVRLVRVGARKLVPVRELERWLSENAETVLERG